MYPVNSFFRKHPTCLLLIQAFLSVWAITRSFELTSRNLLIPIFFWMIYRFYTHNSNLICDSRFVNAVNTGRISVSAVVLSAIFTLCSLLATHGQLTAGLDNLLFRLIILLVCTLGLFFLFRHLLQYLFIKVYPYSFSKESATIRQLPLLSFGICLLGWLPYFLYEYPGIMTPDSINQFEQVLGMIPYSNHHPWAHTMTMRFFYFIGTLFTDNPNAALSVFTMFQMCFMAFCVAWLIATLQRFQIKNKLSLLITAFYAFTPYHAVFAVTLWKDILFSGAVLLFTTTLVRILFLDVLTHSGRKEKIITIGFYLLSGIMFCLYRTNGWYAFLLSLPFLLFVCRHKLKIMLPVHLFIVAFALIIKIPVMNTLHVTQPDFVESLCIPLQQVARVICEDGSLTDEEWDSIHKVIDTTYIKELYSPGFADNMKELVRAGHPEYLETHKGEYLRLWLSLGIRYPSFYLQAYIDQTIGYWYPDVAYTVGDIDGIIPSETGVYHAPLLYGRPVVKAREILLKLNDLIPIYGLLSSMGAMFWLLLCSMTICIMKRKYESLSLFLPGFAVLLTLFIATPVSSEFRYSYSLAYTLPLYMTLPFLPDRKE